MAGIASESTTTRFPERCHRSRGIWCGCALFIRRYVLSSVRDTESSSARRLSGRFNVDEDSVANFSTYPSPLDVEEERSSPSSNGTSIGNCPRISTLSAWKYTSVEVRIMISWRASVGSEESLIYPSGTGPLKSCGFPCLPYCGVEVQSTHLNTYFSFTFSDHRRGLGLTRCQLALAYRLRVLHLRSACSSTRLTPAVVNRKIAVRPFVFDRVHRRSRFRRHRISCRRI